MATFRTTILTRIACLVGSIYLSAGAASAQGAGAGPDPLRFGTDDRYIMFAPFIQFEGGHADAYPDDFLDGVNDTDGQFRRARLYTDFKFDKFGGEFTFDLATDPDPTVTYGYLNYAVTDELTLQVGQQKALFSLQDLTSARPALFDEDSQSSALQPGGYLGVAEVGAAALYGERNWSLGAGVYGTDVNVKPFGQGTSVMGRATYAPILTDEAMVHFGLGLIGTFDPEPTLSFSGDTGYDLFEVSTISTGEFEAVDSYEVANFEFAATAGRFTLESEYTISTLDDRERGNPFLHGGYVGLLAFLTDDHRAYDGSTGTFNKVKPQDPVTKAGGFGAFEIGARLDYLDLSDAGSDAGTEIAGTGIVNWYFNDKLRLSVSDTYTAVTDGADDGADFNSALVRFWFTY